MFKKGRGSIPPKIRRTTKRKGPILGTISSTISKFRVLWTENRFTRKYFSATKWSTKKCFRSLGSGASRCCLILTILKVWLKKSHRPQMGKKINMVWKFIRDMKCWAQRKLKVNRGIQIKVLGKPQLRICLMGEASSVAGLCLEEICLKLRFQNSKRNKIVRKISQVPPKSLSQVFEAQWNNL